MKFIQQTREFLYKWHFDGIDLVGVFLSVELAFHLRLQDWEFPGDIQRGAMNDSREEYNTLIKVDERSTHSGFRVEFLGNARIVSER